MSDIHNEKWLESAQDSFDEALDLKKRGFAEAIIHDVKFAGFTKEAKKMTEQLLAHNF